MENLAARRLYRETAERLMRQFRLTPGNPTERQCAAGARAGGVTLDVARAVYEAMLVADEAP